MFLNNFVALYVFDVHSAFFCHFQLKAFLIKFDVILMLLIYSVLFEFAAPHVCINTA